ncbi:uncharacterized protein LOC130051727 isoform X2 [Ostrea edulis]|nr:uncharacterized protein LOC130051727 isoform X2 [Ostrea edulis]XP_056010270.1 uncharacterized protein LOC130051727 isoform X2 [Ostrea edulis]
MDSCRNCNEKMTDVLRTMKNMESVLNDVNTMVGVLVQNTLQQTYPLGDVTSAPGKKRRTCRSSHRFPESSVKENVHKEVLQEKYQQIVNRLDFSKDDILDKLVEGEAISQSDHETILKLSSKRKDQNRFIISRFRRYGTDNFEKFLESLRDEYPDLMSEISLSYEEKMNASTKRRCAYCMIIQTVDISDVLDALFENKLIDDGIVEQKINGTSAASLWMQVFVQLRSAPSTQECKDILVDTLHYKYRDIAEAVKVSHFHQLFSCSCKLVCRKRMSIAGGFQTDGSGSLSDVSSASTINEQSRSHRSRPSPEKIPGTEIISTPGNNSVITEKSVNASRSNDKEIDVYFSTSGTGLLDYEEDNIPSTVKRDGTRRHTVEISENLSKFHVVENLVEHKNTWPKNKSKAKYNPEFEVLKRKLKSVILPTLQGDTQKSIKPRTFPLKGTYTGINSERYQQSANTAKDVLMDKERVAKVSKGSHTDAVTYCQMSNEPQFGGYKESSFENAQQESVSKLSMQRRKRESPRFKTT